MLVGERMSHPVITIRPDLPIIDALNLMKREKIRRAPVVRKGVLIGIVSDKDLLNASPSPATSLSIWEMNHLLSKVTVDEIMSKGVLTVTEDTPIEEAARTMVDNKIGGLPVLRDGKIVGIITETDLFKIFLELMGAREFGVRITALVQDEAGQLAKLTKSITDAGGNFIAFGQFAGEDPTNRLVTIKVEGVAEEQLRTLVEPLVEEIIDIRVTPT
ncbi:MAG: CBS domain-containing protein [Anaerolineales bacterium]|nr:CBS domain-containing protein [Anaerolineales bacterium]